MPGGSPSDTVATGRFEISVVSLASGARLPVTARGGTAPEWSHDGRQLFFPRDRALLAVDVGASKGEIHVGATHCASNAQTTAAQPTHAGFAFNAPTWTRKPVKS